MKLNQLKTLTATALVITLAACSSAQKNNTASTDSTASRTPAQVGSEGMQSIVKLLSTSSNKTEQQVALELDKMVQNMAKSPKYPGFKGQTFQSVASNPRLAQQLADSIINSIKKGSAGGFNSAYGITNTTDTINAIKKAKEQIASDAKFAAANPKSDLNSDAVAKFWGADIAKLYNDAVPANLKDQVKTRMRNMMQVSLDMADKKDKEFIKDTMWKSLQIVEKTKNDFLGRWVCVTWGDMRNSKALENINKITSQVLDDVKAGKTFEKASDFRPVARRYVASIRGESEDAVASDVKDLAEVCEDFNPAMEATN